nr:hypothetical protein [Caballeronia sp. Lep1P3]
MMKQASDQPDDASASDAPKPPLPHETDQSAGSQAEERTRDVGRQAHADIERGLVDTDRRSGQPDDVGDGDDGPDGTNQRQP